MCCWICCSRDDPSLCMCPGWPWVCIHYPWVKAARTSEFKRGSFPLTSTCILYQPWHYEISYNPIYFSWGARCQTQHRNNAVSRNTKVTCCVDTIFSLCQLHKHTEINTIMWEAPLWLAGVCGIDRYDGANCCTWKQQILANSSWHTASSQLFWPYADLLWLKLLQACHITFVLLMWGLTLCFSFSLSGNNWSWAIILV